MDWSDQQLTCSELMQNVRVSTVAVSASHTRTDMFVSDSIFVESTYSKANAPQPHEILVKSDSVTYATDPVAMLRVQSTGVSKVVTDQSFISLYILPCCQSNTSVNTT